MSHHRVHSQGNLQSFDRVNEINIEHDNNQARNLEKVKIITHDNMDRMRMNNNQSLVTLTKPHVIRNVSINRPILHRRTMTPNAGLAPLSILTAFNKVPSKNFTPDFPPTLVTTEFETFQTRGEECLAKLVIKLL